MRLPILGRRLSSDQSGQDLIEYALVATFISLFAMLGALLLNSATGALYGATGRGVSSGAAFATTSPPGATAPCDSGQNSASGVCK